jgi:predicted TIM-barrel fold metal-dependent hydrolase
MIVDVHYHHIPMLPEEMAPQLAEDLLRMTRILGCEGDRRDLANRLLACQDPTGEKLLERMETAGIDFQVICGIDNAASPLLTVDLVQLQNRLVGEVAQKNPAKILGLAGVDPRRPQALDMLKQCFEEFGLKGLKYHCDYGFDPAGPESYKLLAYVEEQKGILLSHTGPLHPPARPRFADPMLLADIGVDFPSLRVIAAHMGQCNWRPFASLATMQPNLYGDLAMWSPYALGRFELFCRELRDLIDYAGLDKILFATDDPIASCVVDTRQWIEVLRSLPDKAPPGVRFSPSEVDAILGGNAARMLGLDRSS